MGYGWHNVPWRAFNEPLCLLVDRLGSTHELEVEIRIVDMGGGGTYEDIDLGEILHSLTAFREMGRIRLVFIGRDKRAHVVYPLDPCSQPPYFCLLNWVDVRSNSMRKP